MKKSDSDIPRRDFLRGLSISTATLATGPGLRSLTKVLGHNNGGKLGIALLGLGRYSTNQLGPALRETKLCYLAGVVTGHPEKGEKWAVDYGLNRKNVYGYENFEQI